MLQRFTSTWITSHHYKEYTFHLTMKSWGLQTFIKAAHNLFSMVVIIYSVGCKILTIVLILQR